MSTTAITTTVVVSMVKQLEDLEQVQGQLQDSILQLQMTQVQQGKVLQHLSGVIAEQQQQQEIAQLRQQQQQQQQQQQRSLCWLDKEMKHQQKLQQEQQQQQEVQMTEKVNKKFRATGKALALIEQQVQQMQQMRGDAAVRTDAAVRAGLQLQLLQQQQQRDRMQQCEQQQQQQREQADPEACFVAPTIYNQQCGNAPYVPPPPGLDPQQSQDQWDEASK